MIDFIMKTHTTKLPITAILLILSVFLPAIVNAEISDLDIPEQTPEVKINEKLLNSLKEFEEKDKKVVISIINFGRKNPFKPYTPEVKIISKDDEKILIKEEDIPLPPAFSGNINEEITELMNAKVNGILFDPYATSVAIVDIKGSEYMVHEGDIVSGITIGKIAKNEVTLKLGSNSYTLNVGDIVEGSLSGDPVQRKQKIFAGEDQELPQLEFEE